MPGVIVVVKCIKWLLIIPGNTYAISVILLEGTKIGHESSVFNNSLIIVFFFLIIIHNPSWGYRKHRVEGWQQQSAVEIT